MKDQIGVWQRSGSTVFMLEEVPQPSPFNIRNRFTISVQDQPYGSRKDECEKIADAIVAALNASKESDNAEKERVCE